MRDLEDVSTSELLIHLADLLEEDWKQPHGGMCQNCVVMKEENNWPTSCESCVFYNSDTWNRIRDLANQVKLLEMLDAETKDN